MTPRSPPDDPDSRDSTPAIERIELADVRKTYGPTDALDGVSITFEPGGVHALLGPNGSGKTTLFRLVLRLARPDAGSVSVPDATIGCAFQDPQFYEGLTVGENLDLFAELTDSSGEWVEELRERCGLDRVAHRLGAEVSAGVGKRLDLSLALIDRPEVLLLDEPLADVDEEHRRALRELLDGYAGEGRIVVVATHRFDAFESLFDSVAVLDEGRIVARERLDADASDGRTARDLRERYRDALDGVG